MRPSSCSATSAAIRPPPENCRRPAASWSRVIGRAVRGTWMKYRLSSTRSVSTSAAARLTDHAEPHAPFPRLATAEVSRVSPWSRCWGRSSAVYWPARDRGASQEPAVGPDRTIAPRPESGGRPRRPNPHESDGPVANSTLFADPPDVAAACATTGGCTGASSRPPIFRAGSPIAGGCRMGRSSRRDTAGRRRRACQLRGHGAWSEPAERRRLRSSSDSRHEGESGCAKSPSRADSVWSS